MYPRFGGCGPLYSPAKTPPVSLCSLLLLFCFFCSLLLLHASSCSRLLMSAQSLLIAFVRPVWSPQFWRLIRSAVKKIFIRISPVSGPCCRESDHFTYSSVRHSTGNMFLVIQLCKQKTAKSRIRIQQIGLTLPKPHVPQSIDQKRIPWSGVVVCDLG